MLAIRYNKKGESCPVFQCDRCGHVFAKDELANANVIFGKDRKMDSGTVEIPLIVCKSCDNAEPREHHWWMQLDGVLGFLLINYGITNFNKLTEIIGKARKMQ